MADFPRRKSRDTVLEVPVGIDGELDGHSRDAVALDGSANAVGLVTKDDGEASEARGRGGLDRANDQRLPMDGLEEFGLALWVLESVAIACSEDDGIPDGDGRN